MAEPKQSRKQKLQSAADEIRGSISQAQRGQFEVKVLRGRIVIRKVVKVDDPENTTP